MFDNLIKTIKDRIIYHWVLAGHPVTGAFEQNLRHEIELTDEQTTIKIIGPAYGIYKNIDILPENVPFKREPRGRGGKSKYITGLKNWVQMKLGISDDREALGIAFAIATKHSRDGIPGSGWLDTFKDESMQFIRDEVREYLAARMKIK